MTVTLTFNEEEIKLILEILLGLRKEGTFTASREQIEVATSLGEKIQKRVEEYKEYNEL